MVFMPSELTVSESLGATNLPRDGAAIFFEVINSEGKYAMRDGLSAARRNPRVKFRAS